MKSFVYYGFIDTGEHVNEKAEVVINTSHIEEEQRELMSCNEIHHPRMTDGWLSQELCSAEQ